MRWSPFGPLLRDLFSLATLTVVIHLRLRIAPVKTILRLKPVVSAQ